MESPYNDQQFFRNSKILHRTSEENILIKSYSRCEVKAYQGMTQRSCVFEGEQQIHDYSSILQHPQPIIEPVDNVHARTIMRGCSYHVLFVSLILIERTGIAHR